MFTFFKKSIPWWVLVSSYFFISFQFCKLHFLCQHFFLRLLYCLQFLFSSCFLWIMGFKKNSYFSHLFRETSHFSTFFSFFAIRIYIFWHYFKFYYYKCLFALIPDSLLFIPFIFIPSYYLNTLEFTLLLTNIWILQLTTFILKFSIKLLDRITSLVEKRPMWYMVYTYTHTHPYVINTGRYKSWKNFMLPSISPRIQMSKFIVHE